MHQEIKILAVDDEVMILDIFKQYLEMQEKCVVFTADSGRKALGIIEREEIDCCFLDLTMPGMDGTELAQKIHHYDNTIPLVVMTGYPSLDKTIEILKSGVVDFLTKPLEMSQISVILRRIMRERSLLADNILLKEKAKKNEKLQAINLELQKKIKDMKIMNLILRELDHIATSKDLFDKLVQLSAEITNCDQAHLCISNADVRNQTVIASFFKNNNSPMLDVKDIEKHTGRKISKDTLPTIFKGNNGSGHIMAIPLKIRGTVFGRLVLATKSPASGFREKDLYFMNFLSEKASYLIENLALYENIYQNLFSTLYAFVETIEARDPYTKQHSARVSRYAMAIAKEIGRPPEEIERLNVSGFLHDIGKIGIPDNILLKPGRLTDEEFEIIKKHPIIGSNIIGHLGMWLDEQKVIRHHHERFDGNGYPDLLKGKDIPFLSRILAVADVYDALTSDRSYRKRMPDEVVLKIIKENSGSQFDPEIVEIFLELYDRNHGKIVADTAAAALSTTGSIL